MKSVVFSDPQFLDAAGTGGLNSAFNTVSGSIASVGTANWAIPGLVSPEAMTLSFAGMVANVGLPAPWSIITSGGVVVRAHGVLTGQDSTAYSVNLAPLVPASGSITAYLTASITQIQQDPYPIVGPPPGHPSYNANFVPTIGYATNVFSVSVSGSATLPDNVSVFELARATLAAGQSAVTVSSVASRIRSAKYSAVPATVQTSGGVLTLAQAQQTVMPNTAGLTHTLPLASTAGGLFYHLFNPTGGVWTIATAGPDIVGGVGSPSQLTISIPSMGAVTVWAHATANIWEVTDANPAFWLARNNIFLTSQLITDTSNAGLSIISTGINGANLKLVGDGTTTPNKTIRGRGGALEVVNSAYTQAILTLSDIGAMVISGAFTATGLGVTGNSSITGTETVGVLNSNSGNVGGVTFPGGGTANATFLAGVSAIIGGVGLPGAGTVNAGAINGANITAAGNLAGTQVFSTAGNITAQNGRLRATFGAFGSGDINAGVILSDFFSSITQSGYIRFPNNVMIQWGVTPTAVPIDNASHTYNFPTSFSSFCGAVAAFPGAFSPASGAQMGSQPNGASQFTVTVASATPGGTLGTWFIAIGS